MSVPMRRLGVVVLAVIVGAALVVGLVYRDELYRLATHRKGGPAETVAWRPFDDAPDLHLAVAGDTGDSGSRLDGTAAAMAEVGATQPFDSLLLLGDLAYPEGEPSQLDETVFDPFGPVLAQGSELLAVLGNHDVIEDENVGPLMAAVDMPARWWAHRAGDVLIVGLDSNLVDDLDQLAWLDRTLAGSTERWKIVALHHPPYSAGYQGSNEAARRRFAPLFERHGVQLVLSGHDHDYQRSTVVDGVTYVVSGAGAGTRRTGEESFTAVSYAWRHFVEIGVYEDRLVVRAVNEDLRVADEVVLLMSPGVPSGRGLT
jgi:3',5'-cyclic AMP phosphodiesterase CpdA